MNLTDEQLIESYRTMVLIRQFETLVSQGFARGEVLGFVHLGIGQEAVMAGIARALDPGDWVSSTHREHGLLLARGADVNRALAEIFGRATGYCKGKGGSMHLAVLDKHCTGCNGILGRTTVEDIWAGVEAQMRAAYEFVVASPYPSPDEIMTDLEYSEVAA